MSTLASRLESLRQSANTAVTSDCKQATPLWVFLYLYTKANTACYIDYMQGAKALYKYLAPIEYPDSLALDENYTVPSLLRGYESSELAKVLVEYKTSEQLPELRRVERAIMYCMYKEVIPLLY